MTVVARVTTAAVIVVVGWSDDVAKILVELWPELAGGLIAWVTASSRRTILRALVATGRFMSPRHLARLVLTVVVRRR